MSSPIRVTVARPAEWPVVARWAFAHLRDPLAALRADRLIQLILNGEVPSAGVLIAHEGEIPVGGMVVQHLPGGSAVVLPPGGESEAVREALTLAAVAGFPAAGVAVAQAFLDPGEEARADVLTRHGFQPVTSILHLSLDTNPFTLTPLTPLGTRGTPPLVEGRSAAKPPGGESSSTPGEEISPPAEFHSATSPQRGEVEDRSAPNAMAAQWVGASASPGLPPIAPSEIALVPYADADPSLFAETLLATYRDSLDVPEANAGRTAADAVAGYQFGQSDPPDWWLATDPAGVPLGVLLLSDDVSGETLEVAYLGVVPEARGRGVGGRLLGLAIHRAASAARSLNLSVDERNDPARRLYARYGFRTRQQQRVSLWVRANSAR